MHRLAIGIFLLSSAACRGNVVVPRSPGDTTGNGDDIHAGGDGMCDLGETCDDGIDNDCNGSVDEGCGCIENDTVACGTNAGECTEGVQTCTGGILGLCQGGREPVDETCDGLDNDCDGDFDEGCPCQGTETQSCGSDVGTCSAGSQTCSNGAWGTCMGAVDSVAEECDGLDNDCDGADDNGLTTRPAANHAGKCVDNIENCEGASGWVADASNYVPVAEICDGLDNDCAGGADDGLDPRPAANVEGECVDNIENCEGTSGWVADAGNYVPVAEICDGLDNDCAGGADDGLDPRPAANVEGECVDNIENCDGTSGWVADAGNYVPAAEICGDALDSDCDASDDNGCDDDGDNYCDADLEVATDYPAVCPNSEAGTGDDCQDDEANAFPGNDPEICDDGFDNNCDGLTDLGDATACPTEDVIISPDPVRLHHGASLELSALIIPVDAGTAWTREWEISSVEGGGACAVTDLELSDQSDTESRTYITVTDLIDNASRLDCTYSLTVTVNGYATDTVSVSIINDPPSLLSITGAVFDGSAWRLTLAAGSVPRITANAWDAEADGLVFEWSGADVGELACVAPCQSTTTSPGLASVLWDGTVDPATYLLTVELMDDWDPLVRVLTDIVIEVGNCLWVVEGGGGGDGSGVTVNDAMASIQAALDAAAQAADTNACVLGSGLFEEDLVLPASPNTPDLLAGFTNLGIPDAVQKPDVNVGIDAGVTFDPGYAGMVKNLDFGQTDFAPTVADPAVVTITDASPTLLNCSIQFERGTEPVGIAIHNAGVLVDVTAPVINGGWVRPGGSGSLNDATAIRLSEAVGGDTAATIINLSEVNTGTGQTAGGLGIHYAIHLMPGTFAEIAGIDTINATSEDDTALGIYLEPGSEASIHDNGLIRGNGAVTGIGIDLEGMESVPVRADIEGNTKVVSDSSTEPTPSPSVTAGIFMQHSDGTIIRDNEYIGAWGVAGAVFDAGIADGWVERTGDVDAGGSTNLEISGNTEIRGGQFWADPGSCAEGPDVSAGILLVGTTDAVIADNGRPNHVTAGIIGGKTSFYWSPSTRRLVPSNPGLWLIDTANVVVADSEVRSGSLWLDPTPPLECTLDQPPAAIGYRDGIPPNPDFGATASGPSAGTSFTRNGVACEVPVDGIVVATGIEAWCVAVELNGPAGEGAPVLTNSVLAATHGNTLVSLRQRGGSGVVVVNNTLDADLTLTDLDLDTIPSNTITKWPVLLESIDTGGITLINNTIRASNDRAPTGDRDLDLERICIVDVVAEASAGSNIDTLTTSLFHIENSGAQDPLIRVTDGGADVDYDSTELDAVVGATASGNFADLPGLTVVNTAWEKSTMRLLPTSPAINEGSTGSDVPAVDMDGDTRPDSSGLVDIGHDEVP